MIKTHAITYPSSHGGKYHAPKDRGFTPLAACNGRTLLDLDTPDTIHLVPGQERVHGIVCGRCVQAASR